MRRASILQPLPFKTTGVTTEQVISTRPCWIYGITPELTTTGTITLRNQATAAGGASMHVCAIGLTQAGKAFGAWGLYFDTGLTIQLSVNTDITLVQYEVAH